MRAADEILAGFVFSQFKMIYVCFSRKKQKKKLNSTFHELLTWGFDSPFFSRRAFFETLHMIQVEVPGLIEFKHVQIVMTRSLESENTTTSSSPLLVDVECENFHFLLARSLSIAVGQKDNDWVARKERRLITSACNMIRIFHPENFFSLSTHSNLFSAAALFHSRNEKVACSSRAREQHNWTTKRDDDCKKLVKKFQKLFFDSRVWLSRAAHNEKNIKQNLWMFISTQIRDSFFHFFLSRETF